jgi:hypothetical protein
VIGGVIFEQLLAADLVISSDAHEDDPGLSIRSGIWTECFCATAACPRRRSRSGLTGGGSKNVKIVILRVGSPLPSLFIVMETVGHETLPSGSPDYRAVHAELGRILASSQFQSSVRLSRFLEFVVERTLAGEANQLKEYRIGLEVFGRSASYDPRIDPVVRVDHKLVLVPLDSQSNSRLLDFRRPPEHPVIHFAPGGDAVVYPVRNRGVDNLWVQRLDGSGWDHLTDFSAEQIRDFQFSPDGSQLAITRGHIDSDVVLIADFLRPLFRPFPTACLCADLP